MHKPVVAFAALLPGASCVADFVPVSQARSVSATAQAWNAPGGVNPPVSQTFFATDFAPFVETAEATAVGNAASRGHALVDQDSSIGPTLIRAAGAAESFSHVGGTSSSALGEAAYGMTVRFSLPGPTSVRLRSTLGIENSGPPFDIDAGASTELIQHGASDQSLALSQVLWAGAHSAGLDQVLDLPAGEYSLRLLGHTSAHALSYNTSDGLIRATIDVSLTIVPGPGGLGLALTGALWGAFRRRGYT